MSIMHRYHADQSQADLLKQLMQTRSLKYSEHIQMTEARLAVAVARGLQAGVSPLDKSTNQMLLQLARGDAFRAKALALLAKASLTRGMTDKILQQRSLKYLIRKSLTSGKVNFKLTVSEIKAFLIWISLKYEYLKYHALGEHRKPDTLVSNFRILND